MQQFRQENIFFFHHSWCSCRNQKTTVKINWFIVCWKLNICTIKVFKVAKPFTINWCQPSYKIKFGGGCTSDWTNSSLKTHSWQSKSRRHMGNETKWKIKGPNKLRCFKQKNMLCLEKRSAPFFLNGSVLWVLSFLPSLFSSSAAITASSSIGLREQVE